MSAAIRSSRMHRPLSSLEEARLQADGLTIASASFAPGLRLPRHSHEMGSVSVILRGGYDARMGTGEIHVEPGTGVMTPAGEPHENRFFDQTTRILVVEFARDAAWMQEPFGQFLQRPAARHDLRLRELARRAATEIESPDSASALACASIALELVVTLGRLEQRQERVAPAWLLRVRDLMHDACERPLLLSELSRVAGVERSRLLRAFHTHLQASPGTYLRRLRVAKAAELLRESDDPIADIAARTGFADQSHLTRVFKRLMGSTPAAWRARAAGRAS